LDVKMQRIELNCGLRQYNHTAKAYETQSHATRNHRLDSAVCHALCLEHAPPAPPSLVAGVAMVMIALSEGVDIAAATHIFGHHPTTIQRWVERSGGHSQRPHARVLFHALDVGDVQLGELVTRVKREPD
jgi:hypothetical protein